MLPDRAYEDHYPQLQSIVSKILLKRSSNFANLFSHEKFMPFIDMFQKESVKVILLHYIVAFSLVTYLFASQFIRPLDSIQLCLSPAPVPAESYCPHFFQICFWSVFWSPNIIDREFKFYEFFSFLKFNEFYKFFFRLKKNSVKIRNFASHRCLTCFDVLECNVHL